jgi:hypothetical protein
MLSEPCISEIDKHETIDNNDLIEIECKKISVVFSEPFISEIDKHETIYSNDLTKIERT